MPADIDWRQFQSVGDLFEQSCAKFRDRPAYYNMGVTISFGELDRLSKAFGAWLQSKGLPKGARIAIMMPNCLQFPVCAFGALRAGYTVTNVNPLYTPRELELQLKDSGADVIVVLENFAHVLQQVRARTAVKHVVVTSLGEMLGFKGHIVNFVVRRIKKMVPAWDMADAKSLKDVLGQGASMALKSVPTSHEDVAFLQYTGEIGRAHV